METKRSAETHIPAQGAHHSALTFRYGEVSPHHFARAFITTKIFIRRSHFSTIARPVALADSWTPRGNHAEEDHSFRWFDGRLDRSSNQCERSFSPPSSSSSDYDEEDDSDIRESSMEVTKNETANVHVTSGQKKPRRRIFYFELEDS